MAKYNKQALSAYSYSTLIIFILVASFCSIRATTYDLLVGVHLPKGIYGQNIESTILDYYIYYGKQDNKSYRLQINDVFRDFKYLSRYAQYISDEGRLILYIDKNTPMSDVWKIRKELSEERPLRIVYMTR